jgi:signal transduction histidine kinase
MDEFSSGSTASMRRGHTYRGIDTSHMRMRPNCCLFLALLVIARAPAAAHSAPEALVLGESVRSLSIGRSIEVLDDPAGNLTIEDVLSGDRARDFARPSEKTPYASNDSAACWARFRLANPLDRPRELVLEIGFAPLELAELYVPGADGALSVMRAGYAVPFSERPIRHLKPAFPLTLAPGEIVNLYLRIQSRVWKIFPCIVHSKADFHAESMITFAALGLFYGGLIILFLNAFVLVYKLREAATLYLSMFVLSFLVFLPTIDGSAAALYPFVPYRILLGGHAPAVLIENALFLLFTRSYLDTAHNLPRFDRALKLSAAASALALPLIFFVGGFVLTRVLMIATALIGISTGITLYLRRIRRARDFLLALLPVCVTTALLMLRDLSVLEDSAFIRVSPYAGTLCMSFILSSSFADRLRSVTRSYEETMGDLTRLTVMLHNSLLNKLETAGNYLRAQIDSGDLLPEKLAYTQRLLAHCSSEGRNILFTLKNTGCSAERLAQELRFRGEMTLYLREVSFSLVADLESPQERLDPDSVYCVMAVYGELINNVMKHANARVIEVTLVCREGRLTLSVWDDGTGFEYDPRKNAGESYGFKLISEIARASGAVFDVFSSPGRNTLAMISLRPHRPLSPRR